MRVIDYFDRGVSLDPARACLVFQKESKTYRQVQERTHQIASALIADGLAAGTKAAVIGPNSAVAFECVLGIFRADGCWVPINYRNAKAENVYILNHFDVDTLFYHSHCADQIEAFKKECPNVRRFVAIDQRMEGDCFLEEWIHSDATTTPERQVDRDQIVTISPTGGTTGKPKGVMWSNLTWQVMISNQVAALAPTNAINLVVAPMTHGAGVMAMVQMAIGATNVILPGFDAGEVIDAIGRHQVTTLFLPPTALYVMLSHPRVREGDYRSLQNFIYSAAPTSTEKIQQAVSVFGPVMTTLFGQVEAPAACTYLAPSELVVDGKVQREIVASCGRPMLNTRIAIMDDDGHLLPANERGEIVVRSDLVMRGYYKNPQATAEVSAHGWHHTGDVGYLNEDNWLFIVDRKKDMIISGGFNVYPNEVEQVLAAHPAIHDCAVIGVPDEKWGEAVKAVVQLRDGIEITEAQLLEYAKAGLGSVKAPKTIDFVLELPRSAAGKVSKKEIRERYWREAGRSI